MEGFKVSVDEVERTVALENCIFFVSGGVITPVIGLVPE